MSFAINKISDSIQREPPVKATPRETTANSYLVKAALCFFLVGLAYAQSEESDSEKLSELSPAEAVDILNESPWARHQTITRVVGGFGSGVFGEKEIFSRYFVRIVSAQPVRKAYLAIREDLRQQALRESEETQESEQRDVWALLPDDYLVLVVTFRSNDPELEREVLNILEAQTTGILRTKAYLSTRRFPQVEIEAYFPPLEEAVGAKFVFPKRVDGQAIFEADEESFVFEVDFPEDAPDLWVTFPVTEAVLPSAFDQEISLEMYLPDIAEFRILTERSGSLVDLESNRVAAVVNVFPMQQAGTIRGSIYEFHRNDNLDASNFFAVPINDAQGNFLGKVKPEFKRNQFGIALNVALGRRLNLFGSYDGTRINKGSTLVSLVPTAAMKRGDFSLLQEESGLTLWDPVSGAPFPNNQIPEERIHPVAGRLLSLFPDPNNPDPKRNFINSEPEVVNDDTTLVRADFNLRPGTDLRVQYQYERQSGLDPESLPAFVGAEKGLEQEVSIGVTHTFSPRLTGSWDLEFQRESESEGPQGERSPGLVESLGISGISVSDPDNEAYPAFSLDSYGDIGDEGLPEGEVTNDLSLNAALTQTMGNHKLQFEGSLVFNQINNRRSPALERGEFDFSGAFTEFAGVREDAPLCPTPDDPDALCPTGDAFADFLLGGVDKAERAIGDSRQDLRSRSWELRLSEEWRIHPQFILTTGLTYHYFGPYHSVRPNVSVFHPLEFEPPEESQLITVGTAEAERAGLGDLIENGAVVPDRNDWAPRIGLAYRPFTDSRFVVRASYAVLYDPLQAWRYQEYLGKNFPFYFEEVSEAAGSGSGLDLSSPFSTETPTELTVQDIQHDLPTSTIQEWNLSLDHQLTENWKLGIGYRGRRGLNEYRILPANVPLPGSNEEDLQARRPNPTFGPLFMVSAGGSSALHELVIEGERRLTDWYTMQFDFKWQREFDNLFDSNPSNPRNLRAEWAPTSRSALAFSLNYVIDLPFRKGMATGAQAGLLDLLFGGWRVAGITEIQSGRRFSVGLRGDPNNDGVRGDRPDRLGPGQEGFTPTIDAWFDTSVFKKPDVFKEPDPNEGILKFGNAGRNILVGPGSHQWDLSLVKEVFFENGHRLQTRFSFLNAWNQVNFGQPDRTLDSRSFGEISSAGDAREIEIALRYMF